MNLTPQLIIARNAAVKRSGQRPRRLIQPLGNKLASDGPAAATLETNDRAMTAAFVISTGIRDRGGDEMNPRGIQLDNYKTNPIVLFGHGLQITWPIGMARDRIDGDLWVYPEANRVWARVKFSQACPEGKQFYGMVREGTLNATSIGFDAKQAMKLKPISNSPDAVEAVGYRIEVWDLLEFSLVPVPMCQQATRLNSWQAERIASIIGRGRYEGELLSAAMTKALTPWAAKKTGAVVSGFQSINEVPMTTKQDDDKPSNETDVQLVTKENRPDDEENKAEVDPDKPDNADETPVGSDIDKEDGPMDPSDLDKPDDGDEEQPRKAGEVFTEQLSGHLNAILDLLDSVEDTQERQDILDTAPDLQAMLEAIAEVVAELESNGKKKKDDKPDSDKPDDDKPEEKPADDKAKAFRAMVAKAQGAGIAMQQTQEMLDACKELYAATNLTRTQKDLLRKRYQALKKALDAKAPAPLEFVIDPKAIADIVASETADMMRKIDSLGVRLDSLTGIVE